MYIVQADHMQGCRLNTVSFTQWRDLLSRYNSQYELFASDAYRRQRSRQFE